MAGIARQHYYSLDTRERVVHLYEVEGLSFKDVSAFMGGHPCSRTCSEIWHGWQCAGGVEAVRGQTGVRKVRKLDEVAVEALVELVQSDDQSDAHSRDAHEGADVGIIL
ncbi:hypothetical protein TSOC_003491 [Tetrabaena socialis]|uniref:Uncharacterized protein n=1 Tax=Tetrabaena socialis TaxID=47790 RepID=A0A2J8ABF0_9CHLO|nr:hypothetical protein TSOC_005454 [Tetrabaena socialis]PNH09849.1 hypothetical protein TSOC_003491 [Tetrabaena socialis]|eukprot:PNH08011.1 hypothetical protein TSOC_005454 [Tetrabaena socialis]